MNAIDLLGTAAGVGFMAGIRLYATVFVLGLLIRFRIIELSDQFASLLPIASLPVLVISALLAVAEFVSDKVPWFDSIWDTIHTFIRPIGAAALAFTAASGMDSGMRAALVLLTGGVALSAHAAKAATRVAVNHSPEPVSNFVLSIAEDMSLPLLFWFTFHYPLVVLGAVIVFLAAFVWLMRRVIQFLRMRLKFS
jgi:hypothetical protein